MNNKHVQEWKLQKQVELTQEAIGRTEMKYRITESHNNTNS